MDVELGGRTNDADLGWRGLGLDRNVEGKKGRVVGPPGTSRLGDVIGSESGSRMPC